MRRRPGEIDVTPPAPIGEGKAAAEAPQAVAGRSSAAVVAEWLQRIEFTARDEPGLWEANGYHNRGDPWQEQRYSED